MTPLHDALKKLITDFGPKILADKQKRRAYLSDYAVNECNDELEVIEVMFEKNIAAGILKKKTIDYQDIRDFEARIKETGFEKKTVDIKKVVETFCKVLSEFKMIELSEDTVMQDMIDTAKQDLENNEYAKLVSDMNNAIKLYPNEAVFYAIQGAAYRRLEDYNNALASYTAAIRLNPNESLYYACRSCIYCILGVSVLAVEDYNHAVKIEPDNFGFYISFSQILYLRFYDYKYETAIADTYKALQILSNDNLIIRGEKMSDDTKNSYSKDANKAIELINANKRTKEKFRMGKKQRTFYGTWDELLMIPQKTETGTFSFMDGIIDIIVKLCLTYESSFIFEYCHP
jgi:tetratricopeptide (TPR) repeat protein